MGLEYIGLVAGCFNSGPQHVGSSSPQTEPHPLHGEVTKLLPSGKSLNQILKGEEEWSQEKKAGAHKSQRGTMVSSADSASWAHPPCSSEGFLPS